MPPCKILGLPWPEWGETDCLLVAALAEFDALVCSCGCGVWAEDAHDPERRWVVDTVTCYAAKALAKYRDDEKPGVGVLLAVRPAVEGEVDTTEFNPALAAAEYEAHMARFS